jgi:hypothetical protein
MIKLRGLGLNRFLSIPSDLVDLGAGSGGDNSGKNAFHEGGWHEPDLDGGIGQKLEREFRTQYGGTEIHDHHDTIAVVSCSYSFRHAYRVGPEAIIRRAGRDLNAWSGTLHHLQRQTYRLTSQVEAMRNDDDPDHRWST